MKKLLGLFFLLLCACVTEPKVDLNTPEGLYKLGRFYQKQERFEEAINQYRALSHKHPYSQLAVKAELRVADCYFERDEFEEAFAAYKLFKELHPRHKYIDYVTFRAAESLYEQLPSTVDRDLTKAKQAISFYQEVANVYTNSKHSKEAKEKQFELIQKLADKELYVADYYFNQEKYLNSLVRYEFFLVEFPLNKKVPHALLRASQCAKKIDDPVKLTKYKMQLFQKFPNSKEAKKARKVL